MTAVVRRLQGNPWVVLVIACTGYFMTIMNTGSVSIALPTIQADLGAGLAEVLWVVGAYVLALVVLVITAGRLGDLVGPRTVFLVGMLVFTTASALCGFAAQPWHLIGARLLQGVGAALVIPQTLTIMMLVFPRERHGVASSVWGVAAALAGIAGPLIGGLLVTGIGWRWIFWVNLPTGVLTITLALLLVPDRRERRPRRLGISGVVLAGVALGAITFGLLEGEQYGWGTVVPFVPVPAIIGAGVALLVVFVVQQRRARDPLVPPALFGNAGFTLMSLVMALVSMALMTISLSMTLYLQSSLGLSAAQAGLTLVPWAAGMMLGFPVVGRSVDRWGGEVVLAAGLLLYAGCLAAIGLLARPDAGLWALMVPLTLAGVAQAAAFGPIVAMALRDVAVDLVGAASGVFNAIRQVGTLAAVGVMGAVLQDRLNSGIRTAARAALDTLPGPYRSLFVDLVTDAAVRGDGSAIVVPPGTPADVARQMREHAVTAYGHALSGSTRFVLLTCAGCVALAAAEVWHLSRTRLRTAARTPVEGDRGRAT